MPLTTVYTTVEKLKRTLVGCWRAGSSRLGEQAGDRDHYRAEGLLRQDGPGARIGV